MTYIKWKDEVESYLVNMPQEEIEKLFSYFSEMYADKRDAGLSEEQIIEEFGAPYDVAKRVLESGRENEKSEQSAKVSGGGNYNYNYYNYNYGGAPAPQAQPQPEYVQPVVVPQPQPRPSAQPAPQPKNQGVGHVIACVILVVLLIWATAFMIGTPIAMIVEGFVSIGATAGAMVASSSYSAAMGVADLGFGLIFSGCGLIALAPLSLLTRYLWNKLVQFIKGSQTK